MLVLDYKKTDDHKSTRKIFLLSPKLVVYDYEYLY